jgi:glucose-1-phosphate adenylyltransferase
MLSRSELTARAETFILAGGQGKRLYPLTRDRAKPVVSFGGVYRLIDFTLSNCLNSGLRRINILTQHHCESLHSYVRKLTAEDSSSNKCESQSLLCFCPTIGKRYRGTADAVFQNLSLVAQADADFVVILSGDHVYKMDYRDLLRFHVDRGAEATIAAVEYPRHAASQFGVLQVDSRGYATSFEEKPKSPKPMFRKSTQSLISMGVYVFNTRTLMDALADDAQRNTTHDFGKDIIPSLFRSRCVSVYNFTEMGTRLGSYWRDVGTLDSYYSVNMELLMTPFFDAYDAAGWPMSGATVGYCCGPRTSAGHAEIVDSIVADDVWIGSGCKVVHSVLSPGVRIENSATIENSILLHNVQVGAGAQVDRAILDENVRLADGAEVGFGLSCHYDVYDFVTSSGIVVIPANTHVGRSQTLPTSSAKRTDFFPEDPFKTRQFRE